MSDDGERFILAGDSTILMLASLSHDPDVHPTMNPAHWKRLRELYDEVIDLPPEDREATIRRI